MGPAVRLHHRPHTALRLADDAGECPLALVTAVAGERDRLLEREMASDEVTW